MKTKVCFKCKSRKRITSFYRHPMMGDGHLGKCKSCTKTDVSANYRDRLARYKKYDIERNKRPERKRALLSRQSRLRREYPGKYKARLAVASALKGGRIKRLPCSKCGSRESQAHHPDYRRHLAVEWLCLKHHRERHGL